MFRKNPASFVFFCFAVFVSSAWADLNRADQKEVDNYLLTEPKLGQFEKAVANLARSLRDHPELAANISEKEDMTLTESSAALDKIPGIQKAIQDGGISTREFLLFEFATIQSAAAFWIVKQGQQGPPGSSKENLEFYKSHEARFEKLTKDLQTIQSLTSNDDDEDNDDDENDDDHEEEENEN